MLLKGFSQAAEHARNFIGVTVKLFVALTDQKALISGNGGMGDDLVKRAGGVTDELGEIGGRAGGALGDVGRNGGGRASNLVGQPETFIDWESLVRR